LVPFAGSPELKYVPSLLINNFLLSKSKAKANILLPPDVPVFV
jgi:hypothetical protein